ncbi:glycosyltransferase family 4 protein [Terriglobus sp.]|uniref:glycosyltransferase family 4 protein n=1 Tax=Terriglobus sp. TaxID=1889013 RepID=UPI003B002BDC
MKVLHLISSGGMYGAEAVILNLSHALRAAGDESSIAVFANSSRQIYDRAVEEGLPAVLVPCSGQLSRATVKAIREVVRDQRIDLLHAHGYKADLYAWAALGRGGRVPLVSTCHTWYDNDLALRVYGVLDRWVLRGFARVVAVSAEVERQLLGSGVKAGRVRRIQNGIAVGPFTEAAAGRCRAPAAPLRVGLVGRLAPEKGVDIFLDAVAIVAKALPDSEFVVLGEGPQRASLEAQIARLGLAERVALVGHQDSMAAVYARLDLMVSASRQEGLPVALLEGMASGLPVVGTTVGEVPTVVRPRETGLLVTPGDAAALAGAMLEILRDHGLRLRLGQNARALVERDFSADRMTAEYREVYCEALAAAGSKA